MPFLGHLAKLPAQLQWSRAALAVTHFLSDKQKECTLVGGIHVAGAVAKAQLSRLSAKIRSEEQRQSSEAAENFVKSIMDRYYTPFLEDVANCPFDNDSWTKGLGALLCKVGRLIASEKVIDEATQQKFESKLRDTLEKNRTAPLPDRVVSWVQEDVVVSAHTQTPRLERHWWPLTPVVCQCLA